MRPLRLAVAEDDAELRSWLRLALRPLGATIAEASDGGELLRLLLGEEPVDIVVTDIRMPVRSGLDAVVMARSSGVSPPVVFITGYCDEKAEALISGMQRTVLLGKPVDNLDLLDQIRRLLSEERSDRP